MLFITIVGILSALAIIFQFVLYPYYLAHWTEDNRHPIWSLLCKFAGRWWLGSRTILLARLNVIIPTLIAGHDFLAENFSSLDLTPIWDTFLADVPESMRGLVIGVVMVTLGITFEWLRRIPASPGAPTPDLPPGP